MAAAAMLLRMPLLLFLIFFTPVMSSVSVILQRYYYKLTHGKRIFLMSPIHHHFEKKGYSETQIVSMYAGITLILSIIVLVLVHLLILMSFFFGYRDAKQGFKKKVQDGNSDGIYL